MNKKEATQIDSVENAILYIDLLIEHAPNFIRKYSDVIFLHLIQIVQLNEYEFDPFYDILSKTNQTLNQYLTSTEKYFSNNAIELIRKILIQIKLIDIKSINVDSILKWDKENKIKSMALLSVLLEFGDKRFLNQTIKLIKSGLKLLDESEEIRLFVSRNLIHCLGYNELPNEELVKDLFSIENDDTNPSIICGKLQNMKFLILNKNDSGIQEKIIEFVSSFINNDDEKVKENVFDILNTFCLNCDEKYVNSYILNGDLKSQIFNDLHIKCFELARLMLLDDIGNFLSLLSNSISTNTLETLQFLHEDGFVIQTLNKLTSANEAEVHQFIENVENLHEDIRNKVINPVCENVENQDISIRSLVPLVLVHLSQKDFLSNDYLQTFIRLLISDPSEEVKLSILRSFNQYLSDLFKEEECEDFKEILNEIQIVRLLKPLIDDFSSLPIRIEMIKFICLLQKRDLINLTYEEFIKVNIFYYEESSKINNNIIIVPRKLANNSQYLPYLFDAFPYLLENIFGCFFNFAMDFMNITTNSIKDYRKKTYLNLQVNSRTFFQNKFYETIFCSFVKTFISIFNINPNIIHEHMEELINFFLSSLYYGVTERETESVLCLLEELLYKVGLKRAIELNNQKVFGNSNLYKIVFNTSAHFMSPTINEHVFRILGFIGCQLLHEKQAIINFSPYWKDQSKYEMAEIFKEETRKNIYYSICSEYLFEILEDKTNSNSHFQVLEALIKILSYSGLKNTLLTGEIKRTFKHFKEMLYNSNDRIKYIFIPLIGNLLKFKLDAILPIVPDLIKCFVDLWDLGSSSLLPQLASTLKLHLSPYLNAIIPLVLSLEDSNTIVDLLNILYENCIVEVNDKNNIFFDVVNLFIQMINEGKYEALNGLCDIIPKLPNLHEYISCIVDVCTHNLELANPNGINSSSSSAESNSNSNSYSNNNNYGGDDEDDEEQQLLDKKYVDDTFKVLNTLISNLSNSEKTYDTFLMFYPVIRQSLVAYPKELNKIDETFRIVTSKMKSNNNNNNHNDNENDNDKKAPAKKTKCSLDIYDFINMVKKIRNYTDDEIGSLYVKEWLDDLVDFCIKNSPNFMIKNVYPVAKNNRSFAYSIFNIAFYSCMNYFHSLTLQPPPNSNPKPKPNQPNGNPKPNQQPMDDKPNQPQPKIKPQNQPPPNKPNARGRNAPNKQVLKNKSKESEYKNKIKPMTTTFSALFKMNKMSTKCRTVLTNLVEFLDRTNTPIFNCEDLEKLDKPFTSIFYNNQPLALRFSLLHHFELQSKTKENIESEMKKAQTDLEHAFLNVGLLEQYENFINLNQTNNNDDNNNNNDNCNKNNDNKNDNFKLPIYTNTIESIKKANDFFIKKDWVKFDQQIELLDNKIVYHLFKTASLIQKYWSSHPDDQSNLDLIYNYKQNCPNPDNDKLEILKEIEDGFNSLGNESGTAFSYKNASVFQSIIYGQQLIELQEMFLSNCELNNFILRFTNHDQHLSNFLRCILLIRIETKGDIKNSIKEKVALFNLCRRSNQWNLMDDYLNYFYKDKTDQIPIEISYEMMYSKLANNTATKENFESLLKKVKELIDSKIKIDFGPEYEYPTLEKFIKYQEAVYYTHSTLDELNKFTKAIDLCKGFDNVEAINLLSWSNLKLFKYYSKKCSIDNSKVIFYLKQAIKGYIEGSIKNDKTRVSNMISIISLLFNHYPRNKKDLSEIKGYFDKIPLHYFIDPMSQIISYVREIKEDEFGCFIIDLLIKIMEKYPHGVIYDYSFSLLCDERKEKNNLIIHSLINKVKQYFDQHPEKLYLLNAQNIFNQVHDLTTNLYKVSSDISSITINFLTHVSNFIFNIDNANYEDAEIKTFSEDLVYMNENYFIPINNYYNNEDSDAYEPNENERADLEDHSFKYNFRSITNINNEIIKVFDMLIIERKYLRTRLDLKQKYEKSIKIKEKIERKRIKRQIQAEKETVFDLTRTERPRESKILCRADDFINELKDFDIKSYISPEASDSINDDKASSDLIELKAPKSVEYIERRSQNKLWLIYDPKDEFENNIKKSKDLQPKEKDDETAEKEEEEKKEKEEDISTQLEIIKKKIKTNKKTINSFIGILKGKASYYHSFANELAEKAKNNRKEEKDIFKDSPQMANMKNLCLPVFGTFKHDTKPILISRFHNMCTVSESLVQPKKINIFGDDGNKYSFMLKASDDLRIDQRNMIFFRLLNKFLETKIRTYSVVPLTVRFGIVQFVENTVTLKELICSNRSRVGVKKNVENNFIIGQLKDKPKENNTSNKHPYNSLTMIQQYEIFSKAVNKYPERNADLRDSLWISAPNSQTWVKYIVNFSKTCAVTSIVGYIIGIGDRHLCNILMDRTDGCLVQIDFTDCFEVDQHRKNNREHVPFRLTRNIIIAFGPCGYNGTFRTNCEETLNLIRNNREIIYSILEVFSVSTVQPNGRVKNISRSDKEFYLSKKKNNFILRRIEQKLNGTDYSIIFDEGYRKNNNYNKPMSVHDQVDKLIMHASNDYYLSTSFSGWKAWI